MAFFLFRQEAGLNARQKGAAKERSLFEHRESITVPIRIAYFSKFQLLAENGTSWQKGIYVDTSLRRPSKTATSTAFQGDIDWFSPRLLE